MDVSPIDNIRPTSIALIKQWKSRVSMTYLPLLEAHITKSPQCCFCARFFSYFRDSQESFGKHWVPPRPLSCGAYSYEEVVELLRWKFNLGICHVMKKASTRSNYNELTMVCSSVHNLDAVSFPQIYLLNSLALLIVLEVITRNPST
jgi:hypothetical protein